MREELLRVAARVHPIRRQILDQMANSGVREIKLLSPKFESGLLSMVVLANDLSQYKQL